MGQTLGIDRPIKTPSRQQQLDSWLCWIISAIAPNFLAVEQQDSWSTVFCQARWKSGTPFLTISKRLFSKKQTNIEKLCIAADEIYLTICVE